MPWTYELDIVGAVSPQLMAQLQTEFSDVTVAVAPSTTHLRSGPRDQAALIGLLKRLRDLGLEVREVRHEAAYEAAYEGDAPGRLESVDD